MINVDFSFLVTVLYVIVLYIFLSRCFFGPVSRILRARRELIEGRLEGSRKRLELVEQKTAEYERALQTARTEAYRQQEMQRERAMAEKTDLVAKAKSVAAKSVEEGRVRIAAQAETARKKIETEIDTLAKNLTTAILRDN